VIDMGDDRDISDLHASLAFGGYCGAHICWNPIGYERKSCRNNAAQPCFAES
jgi:hypothetical protein